MEAVAIVELAKKKLKYQQTANLINSDKGLLHKANARKREENILKFE